MLKDLFGNTLSESEEDKYTEAISLKNDQRPAKEIFMPSAEAHKRLEKDLDSYTLADLQDYLDPYYKFARKYRLYYIDANGKEKCPPAIAKIISGEKKYKKDWVHFFAIMRYHRNLHYFYDDLPKAEKDLMEEVFKKHFVTIQDASKILGERCIHTVSNSKYYYHHDELIPKLSLWYNVQNAIGYDAEYYFSHNRHRIPHIVFQRGLREELLHLMHPEYMLMKPLEKLPSDQKLLTFDNEVSIFTIYPMLRVMFRTHQIEFGKSKCTATTVKKVAKMTNVKEFFTSGDPDAQKLASQLLTNIYCFHADMCGVGDFAIEDGIKSLLNSTYEEPGIFPALILSHITGFRKNQMNFCESEGINDNILSTLRLYAKDGNWLKAEDICNKVRTLGSSAENYCLWLDGYEFEKMTLKNNYDEHDIFSDNIMQELTYPYIKGYLFMLAVFGMVEIAYTQEPALDATCYYDTLKYVRLTNLGKYVLKIIDKYEQPKSDATSSKLFELYEDNLMVKSLGEVNPYESVLNNMATPISKHLYKVSYESFLSDCTCKSDITNRINMFRDYICKEPPANWERFFKDMEDRCKPMKAPQKKYSLLQIPSANKDLQRIILSDPIIHKYSLKAEGFILLVETSNKGKVVDALKKYGYLL